MEAPQQPDLFTPDPRPVTSPEGVYVASEDGDIPRAYRYGYAESFKEQQNAARGRLLQHRAIQDVVRVSDAYSDLGGQLPESSVAERFDDFIAKDDLHVELQELFERLDLVRLFSSNKFDKIGNKKAKAKLATHIVGRMIQLERTAHVVAVEGNYDNPTFVHFGFHDDESTKEYSKQVSELVRIVADSTTYKSMEEVARAQVGMGNLVNAYMNGKLKPSIDADLHVVHNTETGQLHIHRESSSYARPA